MIVCGGKVSFRKSALKVYGGELHSFRDTPRRDGGGRSRSASHVCRKDWRASSRRDYKPWQTDEIQGLTEALASNDLQLMDWQDFWDTPSMEDYALTAEDLFQPDAEYIRQTIEDEVMTLPVGWTDEDLEEISWIPLLPQTRPASFDRWSVDRCDEQQECERAYDYHRTEGIIAGDIVAEEIDSWQFGYIPEYSCDRDTCQDYFEEDEDDDAFWVVELKWGRSPAEKNALELDLELDEYQALCEPCLEDVLRF